MSNYGNIFSEGEIGAVTIKNRLVMTAMGCGFAEPDGSLNDRIVAYYEARAKGGVGLIITEVTRVNSLHGKRCERQICVDDDRYIHHLSQLADAVHKHGAKVFVQLHHPGMWTSSLLHNGIPLVTPSGIPSLVLPNQVRALSREEITSLICDFAEGAKRAKAAGIDGVEVHAAHFYLLHTFLSPYYNRRTDEYGGNTENRCRIVCEIIQEIKRRCGDDYPVMVRISADEFLGDKGYHLDEGVRIAKILEQYGCDALDVTGGGAESGSSHSIEPPSFSQGWKDNLGAAIKNSVSIPVCMVSAIRDPSYAEHLVKEGVVDFVGMGRTFLADPEWAMKAAEGREQDIRPCILCRRCISEVALDRPVACSVNPLLGKESEGDCIDLNGDGRLVVVVGGGVAGMSAAITAARRGFCVKLYEKAPQVGGSVWLAAQAPYGKRMAHLLKWFERQCVQEKIEMIENCEATEDVVAACKPYAVIIATGSKPLIPEKYSSLLGDRVCTAGDILSGKVTPKDKTVTLIGGGLTGLETAQYLAEKGNRVTVYARSRLGGGDRTVNADILKRLELHNAIIQKGRDLVRIDDTTVITRDMQTQEEYALPGDYVVLSLGVQPDNTLAETLEKRGIRVCLAGDAAGTSQILEAVQSGYMAALQL